MNYLKCKKVNRGKKSNDLQDKQQKKFKKIGRSKKEKNLKELRGACERVDELFSQHYQPVTTKDLGRLRTKGKQGAEGMFLKELGSEYITRKSPDEASEAKKNEDINKIIDLGKVFMKNQERPWSLASTLEENYWRCEDSNPKVSCRKLDFEKEFASFLSKYEETVGANVLLKLPENGVLEDAFEALRKVQRTEEFIENESEFVKELKFLKYDFKQEKPAGESFIENFVFPEKFLIPESHFSYENFREKPLGNALIMTDVDSSNYSSSSFMPGLVNDEESESFDVLKFQEKDFEKTTKDLNITTPPFQFYRRNMF